MRVEKPVIAGTPDVNIVTGWIENKWAASWPKRARTPLRLPHFTNQQRIWHRKRAAAGGRTWIFLQVAREHLLFEGVVAARVLGDASRLQLYNAALQVWEKFPEAQELMDAFR